MQVHDKPSATADVDTLINTTKAIAEKTYEIINAFMQRQASSDLSAGWGNLNELTKLYQEYLQGIWSNPSQLLDAQVNYWTNMMRLWQSTTMSWLGMPVAPIIQPTKSDKRFNAEQWDHLPVFAFIKQAYLLYADYIQKLVGGFQGLDAKTAKQLEFYTRQFVNAISPTNFILTNPQVLQSTLKSHGENLLHGLDNILHDLEKSPGATLKISMTDMSAFKVGENLGITKGKVVFQNDMLQLIQYAPATKQVFSRPLLIIPPWINKFYILDLRPENSLVKYCVDQGYTVFMTSWVNPDKRHAQKGFSEYLTEGSLAAIEVIQQITNSESVNAVGYCLGGTLLAGTLAYLTAKKKPLIESATYLATMLDFAEPGDLGVFTDEPQVAQLEERMKVQGYLDGSSMSTTFNMLRSNELIWSYFINNYLLGQEPFPFDLLYWNCDNTNLPYAMHSFYLRKMYVENVFCKPNGVELNNVPIDISKIKTPAYFLSTFEDHIAPWRSTYAGALLHAGKVQFVLSGSGHIAGVVNPPQKNKYGYWANEKLPAVPDDWFSAAKETPGSWWPHWLKWLENYSGEKVPARQPGSSKYKPLEDAPGSYVKVQYALQPEEKVGSK